MKKKIEKHVLYRFINSDNEIIYIGKTINLKKRIRSHMSNKGWFIEIASIEFVECANKTEMEIYEIYYINKYSPKYNVNSVNGDILSFTLKDLDFIRYDMNLVILSKSQQLMKDSILQLQSMTIN